MEIKYKGKKKCPFGMTIGDKIIFVGSIECQECMYYSNFTEVSLNSITVECLYNLKRGR